MREGVGRILVIDDAATPAETEFERFVDAIMGIAFFITAVFAAKRMTWTRQQGGAETTVVTAFYSLILLTSVLRAIFFLIPATVWVPSYVPVAVFAWDPDYPSWIGAALSEFVLMSGSLALFSIFILILVYWADILKKYFHPASRRSIPMVTFLGLVALLVVLELINTGCFLFGLYTTEGMILFNSVMLAVVSIICVCEITIFSHRFRTVLKTLGAINQVSTDSQVKRIRWITVTGNLFFFTRAFLETVLCIYLVLWWKDERTVARTFTHFWWDTYVMTKSFSEITILSLMLYILQSRFAGAAVAATRPSPAEYVSVPNAEPEKGTSLDV
mmetsp:Transcript_7862/g.18945  ORF Transcript_7862/g.18945 Transcript_7862/m.18945 type:complete len:330 (+) Transcript_7862:173-1162(+)|eukprot:CAMPEP_0113606874 /NCGR_PEP_ID=MMETSP0017_2-20120614/3087_1 /TAXON_ID=2856 /ORGANISM="Cylindrotheca closterium" /LENGTH=329 /DNA_ID=CAMNT_0000515447 /DNA_START=173 /DNA_END=1162 /DNA_ORIENTATION=+ /assembly_acc=CAM_ASM_000147